LGKNKYTSRQSWHQKEKNSSVHLAKSWVMINQKARLPKMESLDQY